MTTPNGVPRKDRWVLFPQFFLVGFDAVGAEIGFPFHIEGNIAMMRFLIFDIVLHFVHLGFADGEGGVAGLPKRQGRGNPAPTKIGEDQLVFLLGESAQTRG